MNQPPPHITLPLETLFVRLDHAGFDCSPAVQMRAYRLLAALGPLPPEPARLRGLLAPLVVRSAEEQRRFYEIFDRYWEEMSLVVEKEESPEKKCTEINKRQLIRLLGGLSIVLGLGIFVYKVNKTHRTNNIKSVDVSFLRVVANNRRAYQMGEMVVCENTTQWGSVDSIEYNFTWSLKREDGSTEIQGPVNTRSWTFTTPAPDDGPRRMVTLTYRHKSIDTLQNAVSMDMPISCLDRPKIPRLNVSGEIRLGGTLKVALAEKPKANFVYMWDVNGDTSIYSPSFSYLIQEEGDFSVSLNISDTMQLGHCSTDTTFSWEIGTSRITLPLKPLQYDSVEPTARFRWPFWVLLGLFALASRVFWMRWSRRKAPPTPEKPPAAGATLPKGWAQANDRPPYYIPFREPKGVLRAAREQLRFGDALRLRQEGEDAVLDVTATLRATTEGGGYPDFRFRFRTRPSEYLFLVDEQMPGKHLARLFRQFAENLRGQDVLLDVLWYDRDFRQFHGPVLEKSVPIDQLRRLFPHHRLVLLGDAHGLLDPYSDTVPRLRPGLEAELAGWKERLLLTPQPPAGWNWRERLLYRHFGLFPADLRGLLDAASFVENGLDTEDLPVLFDDWQAQQQNIRSDSATDTNYRRWRTLRDHDDYLQQAAPAAAKDLRRWLCAIAVLPNPTWEITLLVAQALGIAVQHDRLLVLSRIPWLQDGNLHPRLRRELLTALSEADERLARTALRDELEVVRPLTADSHAAHELEGALAMQQFLLEPEEAENRNLIGLLLHTGALTRVQEDELDLAVERWDARDARATGASYGVARSHPVATDKRGIREWLAERKPTEEEAPIPPRPFWTKDLAWAVLSTLLFLTGVFAGLFYHDTSWLSKSLFDRNAAYTPEREKSSTGLPMLGLQQNFWVKEYWFPDSAVIYNNRGVDFSLHQNIDSLSRASSYFRKAWKIKGKNYPNAYTNWTYAFYNQGCVMVEDLNVSEDSLRSAAAYFKKSALLANFEIPKRPRLANTAYDSDPLKEIQIDFSDVKEGSSPDQPSWLREHVRDLLDAWHGRGIAFYYAGEPDSAKSVYQQLLAQKYFDTLQLRPNLQTLLSGAKLEAARIGTEKKRLPNLFKEPEMVFVKGGTFRMGATDDDKDANEDEKPVHNVTLKNYYIGRTEVTNAQYADFLNDYESTSVKSGEYAGKEIFANKADFIEDIIEGIVTDYTPKRGYENHPVVNVSWYGAVEYCNWLSQKTGKRYRLPTEAEWEYAARGGARWQDGFLYAGGNTLDEVAWHRDNSNGTIHTVAGKKANQLGLYDMCGNVYEWCSDWYVSDYYKQFRDETAKNPQGPDNGSGRVLRGGSWYYFNGHRSTERYDNGPTSENSINGFRVVHD